MVISQDYISNSCALNQNKTRHGINMQAFRKGLYAELFMMFLIYFAGQIYQTIKSRPVDESLLKQGQKSQKFVMPWHEDQWNKLFPIIFTNHGVALGFVILFYPFAGAIIIALSHLLFFIGYVAAKIKLMENAQNILHICMNILNLFLIIMGMYGINLASMKNGVCNDTNL